MVTIGKSDATKLAPAITAPGYSIHKASGQGVARFNGKDVYFGKDGEEARAKYRAKVGEWLANGKRLPPPAPATVEDSEPAVKINDLRAEVWLECKRIYPAKSAERNRMHWVLKLLGEMFGTTLAKDFGPLALRSFQGELVARNLARVEVNRRVRVLRRLFRLAVSLELIEASVWSALKAVDPVKAGQTTAAERPPIQLVSEADFRATLPLLPRRLAAVAELQWLTGLRPGEALGLRMADIDMGAAVWIYRPPEHKGAHRGAVREIPIGPRAQEVLRPWLRLDRDAYLFSPREEWEERMAALRAARKSKVQPSQESRRKANPKRKPGERFQVTGYAHVVKRAIDTENEKRVAADVRPIAAWTPHALRRSAGTRVRAEFGLEAARSFLGHRTSTVTEEHYAEMDKSKNVEIAARLG